MYCSKCGGKIEDNARYCDSCGEIVVKNSERPSTQGGALPNAGQPTNGGSPSGGSNGSSSVWLPVGIAAIGVVIGWYLSGLWGLVLGIIGASMTTKQKN